MSSETDRQADALERAGHLEAARSLRSLNRTDRAATGEPAARSRDDEAFLAQLRAELDGPSGWVSTPLTSDRTDEGS
jgi:hypothetical protein